MTNSRWQPGITYRNLYENGAIGEWICADREMVDKYASKDGMPARRVAVLRITAKAR